MEKIKCLWAFIRFLWSNKQTGFIRAINKNGICYVINIYRFQTVEELMEELKRECT